ncbi:kinase-like protein [Basidiobolus meristosporus CBS 931.73]|uniref:Kinase-like protein n=1 Tax=Basidiobolus meristosporus CBS 931.73 TaxID=1314790 RepID=A0A1Y1YIT7_9FUNG|nr:kinase-like protein [Basidiobolus meristosporus CBS 931.73]|eukprot:ORX97646.1 kinase-like protein [Basidiobolus meristosporus CBS 931.73]
MGKVKESLSALMTESEDGVRQLNQYTLKEKLGQGAYGSVYYGIDGVDGSAYAIKELSKAQLRKNNQSNMLRERSMGRGIGRGRGRGLFAIKAAQKLEEENGNPLDLVRSEVAILKKLSHPNIVNLREVLDNKNDDAIYMVFEMCKKGAVMDVQLGKTVEPYTEDKCRHYFRQMVLGFEYLHENGIVHRDIKPDNLLIAADDTLKIVDFGVSEMFVKGDDRMKKSAGSPAFMAPELCSGSSNGISGRATDIWSMGVTLYCLAFGTLPFSANSIVEIYDSVKNQELKIPDTASPELKDLLEKLLDKNPETRIHMDAIRIHPWLTKDGQEPLPSTEENCATVVTSITDEEINSAIRGIANIMTVAKAVARFKRRSMQHHMQNLNLNDKKSPANEENKDTSS